MSTSKSAIERYHAKLTSGVTGRPGCRGWLGKIDRYGNAQFSWTDETGHHTGNAARWSWEYHRGQLPPQHRLRNSCGLSSCQKLDHWHPEPYNIGLSPEEQYEAKIDRSGGSDACHPWTGGTDKDGYGLFSYRRDGRNVTERASRFGWRLANRKSLPSSKVLVCHSCDNPPCQNPRHWFIGPNQANMDDMVAKGRATGPGRGESHHKAIMTDVQVLEARARFTGRYGEISALAREYGVAPKTMNDILRGKRR